MIWPAAALAVFLLGFVVVYGSVLQARVEAAVRGAPAAVDAEPNRSVPAPLPAADAL